MRYIEALDVYDPKPGDISLFLGGGISNCPDWQAQVLNFLTEELFYRKDDSFVLLNPRRANFPMDDPSAAEAQIKWEHHHLKLATMVMFWFPCETLCPITLFEYGKHLIGNKPLYVGCDPEYKRKIDLEVQTNLERPFLKIHNSIEDVCRNVISEMKYFKGV